MKNTQSSDGIGRKSDFTNMIQSIRGLLHGMMFMHGTQKILVIYIFFQCEQSNMRSDFTEKHFGVIQLVAQKIVHRRIIK